MSSSSPPPPPPSTSSNKEFSSERELKKERRRSLFDDPFFDSSWEEFERFRKKMISESNEMWKSFKDQDYNIDETGGQTHHSHQTSSMSMTSSSSTSERKIIHPSSLSQPTHHLSMRSKSPSSSGTTERVSFSIPPTDYSDDNENEKQGTFNATASPSSTLPRKRNPSFGERSSIAGASSTSTIKSPSVIGIYDLPGKKYQQTSSPKVTFGDKKHDFDKPKKTVVTPTRSALYGSESTHDLESSSASYSNRRSSELKEKRDKFFNDWMTGTEDREQDKFNIEEPNQNVKIRNDDQVFEITLDITDYQPNELTVTVGENRVLVVEGKHEDEHFTKNFIRKYTLPPSVDVDEVFSTLSTVEKTLVITAPKKDYEIQPAHHIQITMKN